MLRGRDRPSMLGSGLTGRSSCGTGFAAISALQAAECGCLEVISAQEAGSVVSACTTCATPNSEKVTTTIQINTCRFNSAPVDSTDLGGRSLPVHSNTAQTATRRS